MTDGDAQAYPLTDGADNEVQTGLTKREYFAAMALQGLCANRWTMETGNFTHEDIAVKAVNLSAELIIALNED